MIVSIYRRRPNLAQWANTEALYTFAPVEDDAPFAVIDVPAGWMLVGEPEPVLVKRLDLNIMTNRDASEALMSALIGAEGFAIHTPPAGGMPMLWAQAQTGDVEAQAVVLGVSGQKLVPPADSTRALPHPSRNGKAIVPANRRRGK